MSISCRIFNFLCLKFHVCPLLNFSPCMCVFAIHFPAVPPQRDVLLTVLLQFSASYRVVSCCVVSIVTITNRDFLIVTIFPSSSFDDVPPPELRRFHRFWTNVRPLTIRWICEVQVARLPWYMGARYVCECREARALLSFASTQEITPRCW